MSLQIKADVTIIMKHLSLWSNISIKLGCLTFYLRQINIAHLNINQVSPVRYLEHLVFTTMKTTLANYTQIQSQVLST